MKTLPACLSLLLFLAGQGILGTALAQRPPLNPDNVFIPEDTDSFDPGLPIGTSFPPIRALYQGREITDVDQFIRDKGAVFLVNRSVDW